MNSGNASGQNNPVRGLKILVVDDSVDSARILAMLLKIMGHQTQTAFDGVEALKVSLEFRPELIFLDIGLPRMDGYETARRLRQMPELKGTSLVAMTGHGDEEHRKQSQAAGFDHHLVKPVEHSELERFLTKLQNR